MSRPLTLRGRIALVALAVTGGWVALLTVGFNLAVGAQLEQQASSVLRARGEAVASTVDVSPSGVITIRDTRDDTAIDVGTWIFAGTRILEAPPGRDGLQDQATALADHGERELTAGTADPVRFLALPVSTGGTQVATVVTTLSLAPYRQIEKLAGFGSGILALFLLAGVYFVVRVSTDRALRPVQEMAEQAGRWSAHDVDRRFGTSRRPAELEQLAGRLDGLLDRLSAVLRHERSFSAQISHELRTPLTTIVAETSLLRSHPRSAAEVDVGLEEIAAAGDRMAAILETLLASARSDGGTPPGQSDLHDVAVRLRERWRARADLIIDVPTGTMVGADDAVVERILSPILDNAARYARSSVTIKASVGDRGLRLEIHDDGPGIAPDVAEHIFEPGWRADHARPDGAGLGLALVRRLVTSAGGTVSVSDRTDGATLIVNLPRG